MPPRRESSDKSAARFQALLTSRARLGQRRSAKAGARRDGLPTYGELARAVIESAFENLPGARVERLAAQLHPLQIHCGGCNWCQGERDYSRDNTAGRNPNFYHCNGCNDCQGGSDGDSIRDSQEDAPPVQDG